MTRNHRGSVFKAFRVPRASPGQHFYSESKACEPLRLRGSLTPGRLPERRDRDWLSGPGRNTVSLPGCQAVTVTAAATVAAATVGVGAARPELVKLHQQIGVLL